MIENGTKNASYNRYENKRLILQMNKQFIRRTIAPWSEFFMLEKIII